MSRPSTLLDVPAACFISGWSRLFSKLCPPRIEVAVRKGRGGSSSGCIVFKDFMSTEASIVLFLSSTELIPLFSTPTTKLLMSFLFLVRRRQQKVTMRTKKRVCQMKDLFTQSAIQTKDDNKEKSNGQSNIERVLGIVCSQETHLNLHDDKILSTFI